MKRWSNSPLLGEIVAETSMSLSVKNRMKKVYYRERFYIYIGVDMEPFSVVLFNKEPFKNLTYFLSAYQWHF